MIHKIQLSRFFAGLFLTLLFSLSAISQAQSTQELMLNPKVGDVYVGRVDEISSRLFGRTKTTAYGLLKVTNVFDNRIIVITSQQAWSDSRAALEILNLNMEDVAWDTTEEIELSREKLKELVEKNLLITIRQP